MLAPADYDAYVIARLETEFGAEMPDPADFVTDEFQRFLDARARLLSAGAGHLDEAVAAEPGRARAEAARVRALAAFARSRPAAMFDRAPGERGAASAASVAARPGALTDVSEWAVDEAAATLGVSARGGSMLLVDAVTLVEGLPATLAALSAGDICPGARPGHGRARRSGRRRGQAGAGGGRGAAAGRASRPSPALRARVRRAVARIDAAAARGPAGQGGAGPAGPARSPRRRHVHRDRAADHAGGPGLP